MCNKIKEGKGKKTPEEIRVMLITLELVGFRWMVRVLNITSLMSVVQHST